jgi:hypothetical protein
VLQGPRGCQDAKTSDNNPFKISPTKNFSEDTIVWFNYLPTIHAAVALLAGSATKAIEALAPAAPYELGSPAQSLTFVLYPVYLRGEA